MNLSELKLQIRTETGITSEAAWQESVPKAVTLRPGVDYILYSTTVVTDGIGVDVAVQIYVLARGEAGELAWYCRNLSPNETDPQRFRRLALEWCAARVAAGWFITINHWGDECALGWGLSELGVYRTMKLDWDAGKTAITPTLDVPIEPSLIPKYQQLPNGTTALPFATYDTLKLTPTASATLTATIPPAGTKRTLMILTSGTTSYTLTAGSGMRWTATLATGATSNRVFTIPLASDGTTLYEDGLRSTAMTA